MSRKLWILVHKFEIRGSVCFDSMEDIMVIKVAIADTNEEYIERLSNGLQKYKDFYISVYTDKKGIEGALQTKRFDVILFSPDMYNSQITLQKSTLALMLFDESEFIPEDCRSFSCIKKYQRISSIYKRILELYADICQSFSVSGNGKTVLTAVYSPIGGSGKTTVSCALANYLSLNGKKVLYLNFEEVASDNCYFPQSDGKSMSDLMGYIESDINFGIKLQGIQQMKKENLYYINHFKSPNDLYEITDNEIEELFSKIINSDLYDNVIVDMGGYLDHKAIKVFDSVENIVVVDKNDVAGRIKMDTFMSQAHIMNEYGYKMIRIINFGRKATGDANDKIKLVEVVENIQSMEPEKIIGAMTERYMGRLSEAIVNS
jgi:cellulose biosynthesis protein BcsQ